MAEVVLDINVLTESIIFLSAFKMSKKINKEGKLNPSVLKSLQDSDLDVNESMCQEPIDITMLVKLFLVDYCSKKFD